MDNSRKKQSVTTHVSHCSSYSLPALEDPTLAINDRYILLVASAKMTFRVGSSLTGINRYTAFETKFKIAIVSQVCHLHRGTVAMSKSSEDKDYNSNHKI